VIQGPKDLAAEERGLLDAIRKAPSAAEVISVELEKVASHRKALERELKTLDTADGNQGGVTISKARVDAFRKAVKPYMKAMDVGRKKELSLLLGFEATVSDKGEVKASIAIPSYSPLHEHGHDNVNIVIIAHGTDDAWA
jgi:hypothetical protein